MSRHRLVIAFLTLAAVLVPLALLIGSAASGHDPGHSAPIRETLPRISGTPQVGHVLYAHPGLWSGASTFTYRWQRCNPQGAHCRQIDGPKHRPYSRATYTIVDRDAGHRILAVVTAWNRWGHGRASSRPTAIVTRYAPHPGPGGVGPGRGQSVGFWLAWVTNMNVSQIPWNAVTQVDLFSLATCTNVVKTGCSSPSSLNTAFNGVNLVDVPQWVSTVHQHHRLAIIAIGGSTNPDWHYACSSANVAPFASNLVNYMRLNGFDGIDLDIEQDPGSPGSAFSSAELTACAQAVYNDAKAIKTAAGKTPLVTSDVDPTTSFDIGAAVNRYVDQFNMMSYGHTCANNCSQLAADIAALKNNSGIPASKITVGMDIQPGDSQAVTRSDCGNIAKYASTAGVAGVMVWTLQGDAAPCLSSIAPYVAPATP